LSRGSVSSIRVNDSLRRAFAGIDIQCPRSAISRASFTLPPKQCQSTRFAPISSRISSARRSRFRVWITIGLSASSAIATSARNTRSCSSQSASGTQYPSSPISPTAKHSDT
jgi:hypothetical protein